MLACFIIPVRYLQRVAFYRIIAKHLLTTGNLSSLNIMIKYFVTIVRYHFVTTIKLIKYNPVKLKHCNRANHKNLNFISRGCNCMSRGTHSFSHHTFITYNAVDTI